MKLSECCPDFQKVIADIAKAVNKSADDVFALWTEYENQYNADESVLLREFVMRKATQLGADGDVLKGIVIAGGF